MLKFKNYYKLLSVLILAISFNSTVNASVETSFESITLEIAQGIDVEDKNIEEDSSKLQMRLDAMREAAMSYGALSGMVYRNWEIYKILERQEVILDTVFNFSRLTIPTHYGTLIEPPIVSESDNAFLLGEGGMTASITSKVYGINENAKIVTAPRNWRSYLMDNIDLEHAEKPDIILRPRSRDEKKIWDKNVAVGWRSGVEQANDIFSDNLSLLLADYEGMIRYRKLLAQNMISAPFAVKENRGVTGNSNELRIDDKAVIITSIPALNQSPERWEPTER